jgi:amino-acid N-acetyltransferase
MLPNEGMVSPAIGSATEPKLRRATVKDVTSIQQLVNSFADKGEMLPRSLNDIYENLRDYFVLELNGDLIGTVACHVNWEDLAEIKSLAIAEAHSRKGYGTQLVQACVDDAVKLGIRKLFALSYKPEFFKKMGWREVEKSELPHKVWQECIRCVKFPDCGEIALVFDLEES